MRERIWTWLPQAEILTKNVRSKWSCVVRSFHMPTHCKAGHPSLSIFNSHLHNSGRTARIANRNSEPNRPNETCWGENLRLEVLNQELIRAAPHLWRVIGPRTWKSTFFFSPFFSLAFVWGATWYVGDIFLPCLPDRETCCRYGSRWLFTSRGNYRQIIVPPSCHQNQEKSFFSALGRENLWNVGRGQNYHVTAFSLTLIFFPHFSAASQGGPSVSKHQTPSACRHIFAPLNTSRA